MLLDVIGELKKSPLFNLSLSSKELFHSNFLFWLGNICPSEVGELFSQYLTELPDNDLRISNIFREKENIDLSFVYSNGQEIILENKVKSIPYASQLASYSKDFTNQKNYILLSLSEPMFFESKSIYEINGAKWHYLSYADLSVLLKSLLTKIKNGYHKNIVADYCDFIDGLVEINEHCAIKENDFYNFHSVEHDDIYQQLIEIRLHDFYLKKKCELMAFEVYKELKSLKMKKNIRSSLTEFGKPMNWENESPIIFLGYGMSRSQGLMDMKFLVSKNVALGVQIQGNHYRMVIEDRNGKVAKIIKNELDQDLWFDLSRTFPNSQVYPKKGNQFNKYGDSFFYKSVKLGTNLKIKDLKNIIVTEVQRIESNIPKFRKIISQASIV